MTKPTPEGAPLVGALPNAAGVPLVGTQIGQPQGIAPTHVQTNPSKNTVWEIGSGTGQHACYFARHLPHIEWQPTDRSENISGICMWREEAQLANLKPPITLDVTDIFWPCNVIDALFTANTLHIMSRDEVRIFFARLTVHLNPKALMCIYGPFNYNGAYTSDSNARFDQWLKSQNISSCIKDFEDIMFLARSSGFGLVNDFPMPANNRLLVLQKQYLKVKH